MSAASKILTGLQEAIDAKFARVTIDGVTWVRQDLLAAAPSPDQQPKGYMEKVLEDMGQADQQSDNNSIAKTSASAVMRRAAEYIEKYGRTSIEGTLFEDGDSLIEDLCLHAKLREKAALFE